MFMTGVLCTVCGAQIYLGNAMVDTGTSSDDIKSSSRMLHDIPAHDNTLFYVGKYRS